MTLQELFGQSGWEVLPNFFFDPEGSHWPSPKQKLARIIHACQAGAILSGLNPQIARKIGIFYTFRWAVLWLITY